MAISHRDGCAAFKFFVLSHSSFVSVVVILYLSSSLLPFSLDLDWTGLSALEASDCTPLNTTAVTSLQPQRPDARMNSMTDA